MPNLRLFTAVELPPAISGALADACSIRIDGLRWVNEKLLHITLKFIGDFPEARLNELAEALKRAPRPSASLKLGPWLCFPEQGRVRIVGAGLIDSAGELTLTYESIEEIATTLGVSRENRKYTPHITLGRTKFPIPPSTRQTLDARPLPKLEFKPQGFALLASELTHTGPLYRVVSHYII